MGNFSWDNLQRVWANTEWSWILLWFGIAALIVALIVLMRTSWGQSQPLRKCAVLSLLAHLLLAAYATTVEIVTASGSRAGQDAVRAVFWDNENDWSDSVVTNTSAKGSRPWDQFPGADNSPQLSNAAPSDLGPTVAAIQPPELVRPETAVSLEEPAAAISNNNVANTQSDSPPALPAVDTTPTSLSGAARTETRAAEPIDITSPEQNNVVANGTADSSGPERVASITPSVDDPFTINAGSEISPDRVDPLIPTTSVASSTTLKPVNSGSNSTNGSTGNSNAGSRNAPSNATGNAGGSPLVPVVIGGGGANNGPPSLYKDRTAQDRAVIAQGRGGSPEAEAAVQAALKWLSANQSPDGRWDADKFGAGRELNVLGHDRQGAGAKADTGISGLAMLAFLGAGNTHLQGKYKDNVRNGLEFLLNEQATDGNLGGKSEMFAFMYSHGIATLALSEAFAMTGDTRLEKPLRAAIAYSVSAQHQATGSWRYRPGESGDTSQLGWQLMALKSAELAGIAMPDQTRNGMIRYLKATSSGTHGGLAGYRPGEKITRPMTAEALVCRQFLGMTRDNPAANEAGDYLLNDLPNNNRVNLYYWYYGTLSMYQLQGEHWERWNKALQATLIERQVKKGDTAGSWEPDCVWAGYGGRVYSTAMAALCLEVYYRYLPLYGDLPE